MSIPTAFLRTLVLSLIGTVMLVAAARAEPAGKASYRVYKYTGQLALFGAATTPAPAEEAAAAPADDTAEEPATQEVAGEPGEPSGAITDTASAATEAEPSEPAATPEVPAPEGEGEAAATVEAAAGPGGTPEIAAVVQQLTEDELLAAVLASPALRAALSVPIPDPANWELLREKPVDAAPKHGRSGAVLVVDGQLQVQQLPAELSDHLAQAVAGAGATAPISNDRTAGILDLLAAELERPAPSADVIARMLERLQEEPATR
jgi:hypothetical protein